MTKKGPPRPDEDDQALWLNAMRDTDPLDHHNRQPAGARTPPARKNTLDEARIVPSPALPKAQDMDRRTEERFRQGRMAIEARLDLHGLTLVEAHTALQQFIRLQYASGARCLLVITGKGERPDTKPWYEGTRGQIKRNMQQWLAEDALRPMILSVAPARQNHGGQGAFYVLLRRRR